MRIVITDVTEMREDNYCVAGWRPNAGRIGFLRWMMPSRMIRPLPNGGNWTAQLLARSQVAPGAMIEFRGTGARPTGFYPHLTEDTPIDPGRIKLLNQRLQDWFGADAPPTAATLTGAFGGHLQKAKKGAYVQDRTRVGSLAAVKTRCGSLEFYEDDYPGGPSLRAYLEDSVDRYSLPVVAKSLRETYRSKGPSGVNQLLPNRGYLHVRVGLARASVSQGERCVVMINGVYW
jgi:hypothetical protein